MKTTQHIENTVQHFSVTDRLILRLKVCQHLTRSLAEKQALIKFFDLRYDISGRPPTCHPTLIGPCLRTRPQLEALLDKQLNFQGEDITLKQKRFLIPAFTNFMEVRDRTNLRTTTRQYQGRIFNLRVLPERKFLEESATLHLFSFYVYHCNTYIPCQVMEITVEREPLKDNFYSVVQEWFYSVPLQ